jgi:toxin FitB
VNLLLDTCVLSETVRRDPAKSVLSWLDDQDELGLFISVLTLGEIHKGVAKLVDKTRKDRLIAWLEEALVPRFGDRILSVDARVAATWGGLAGVAERAGTPVPVIDGLIAATAQVHGLGIATRNGKHFSELGITVIDPWDHE